MYVPQYSVTCSKEFIRGGGDLVQVECALEPLFLWRLNKSHWPCWTPTVFVTAGIKPAHVLIHLLLKFIDGR